MPDNAQIRKDLLARHRQILYDVVPMAAKSQLTGMLGVYLAAAELTNRGFIVSPTSRSAFGADLLVTDQNCQRAWSIQVKTQRQSANFWLVNKDAIKVRSDSHLYIFINLKGNQRPEYIVVPSHLVAEKMRTEASKKGSVWYSFARDTGKEFIQSRNWKEEGWEIFGDPLGGFNKTAQP